jgi:acetyltransferase-like isoleucine patch superfamily enzyme
MDANADAPHDPLAPGEWRGSLPLPPNVQLGDGTLLIGDVTFRRFRSTRQPGLTIGQRCVIEGVQCAVGKDGVIQIGDECCLENAVLLAEEAIRIGNQVLMGWNVVIADTDFHPIAPAERIADAIALSPGAAGVARPAVRTRPVIVGNRVYIGPAATILKGVTIGDDAWIEPGAVVTRDVPPGARMLGNPARDVANDAGGAP